MIDDAEQQHRFRRSICKGWRNKAWHGRLMAFLQFLSGDSEHIALPLSASETLRLDGRPMLVTSPVTTALPDLMTDEAEENDLSTLGDFDAEEEG